MPYGTAHTHILLLQRHANRTIAKMHVALRTALPCGASASSTATSDYLYPTARWQCSAIRIRTKAQKARAHGRVWASEDTQDLRAVRQIQCWLAQRQAAAK